MQTAICLSHIDPCEEGLLNVIIETPKNSRNKYKYDEKKGIFMMAKVLPAGSAFPYDFGFLPNTLADDGDPIDVLLLMDVPAYPGCLIPARPIGIIEAKQGKKGAWEENDRIVAVADKSHDHSQLKTLKDVNPHLLEELEQFFVNYHALGGNKYKLEGCHGPREAVSRIKKSIQKFKKK